MNQPVDLNLIELARKWCLKFIHYGKLIPSLQREEWLVHLTFYRSLLEFGCELLGRVGNEVLMRCDKNLVEVDLYTLEKYARINKEVKREFDKLKKMREIETEELNKLRNILPVSMIDLTSYAEPEFPMFMVYGTEPIYLMSLNDVSLYLDAVDVTLFAAGYALVRIDVKAKDASNKVHDFISVKYRVESMGETRLYDWNATIFAREILLRKTIYKEKEEQEKLLKEVVGSIIKVLNEKYPVIDDLLRNAEGILIKGLRGLTTVLLY